MNNEPLSIGFIAMFLLWAIVTPFIYFLPTIIGRKKRQCRAIFALNFFLGWTFVGWVIALVWSCAEDRPEDAEIARPLNVGLIIKVVIFLNLLSGAVVWYLIEAAAKEQGRVQAAAVQAETAERERVAAEKAERETRIAAIQAEAEAARAERERARLQTEFEALPKWDKYGKPINRVAPDGSSAVVEEPPVPLASGSSIFPAGVDTPEQRRDYLQELARQKKQAGQAQPVRVRDRGY